MLLLALRRGNGATLTICPLLWAGVLLPGIGLLSLLLVGMNAWRTGSGVLWTFLVMSGFFLGTFAYAFYRAANAQRIRCRREDSRLLVSSHTQRVEVELRTLVLSVEKSRVGVRNPITVHDVTLRAPGWRKPFILHRGLTAWGAQHAAASLREHLDVSGGL